MEELFKSAALLVVGGLVQYLVARFNKNKAERDSGLVSDYIKITDMTGAQLERKINQIDKLEAKIAAMEVAHKQQITELQVTITNNGLETQKKLIEVQEQAKAAHRKYRIMKGITQKLVRALQENDPPIAIPDLNGDIADLGESALDLPLTDEQRKALKGKPH